MASSISVTSLISRGFFSPSNPNNGFNKKPTFLTLRSLRPTASFARKNKKNSGSLSTAKKKTPFSSKIKNKKPVNVEEEDDLDEDAIEALFSQLEEDLKNDLSDNDLDDEITEEDLAKLEQELGEALGDVDFDELPDNTGDHEESDEEERPPKLKNWQVKRLAYALKVGRRKTSIKSLAAELGLDRAFVLEMLRDPPPHLLLMSASLPDKVSQMTPEFENKPVEPATVSTDIVEENEPEVKEPVHVRQTRWSMQKRLKKVQVETLERVYSRTKRPTNAMISSIVHVTNLPWKRIVKWFEDKRAEDGVPENRVPFRRSEPETIYTS